MPALFPFRRHLHHPSDDLGLGTRPGPGRSVNKDGSFNVRRVGVPHFRPYELYHDLITMSLPRFILVLVVGYVVANLSFAGLYLGVGMQHFDGVSGPARLDRFLDAFFFSAQTLTTVGNGHIHPIGTLARAVAALESMVGLMGFALGCGLVYGRFSRPHARILYSRHAVIAPFRGHSAFMFRIVNERSNQLIEVGASVSLSLRDPHSGARTYANLTLDRPKINLFPSNWTVVHAIDPGSPLAGMTEADLLQADAEFIVLIKAFDETFAQTVFSRSSYKAEEVLWGRKFVPMFGLPEDGLAVVDLALLDALEPAELP